MRITFKQAVQKAKSLYKSGKYKRFSDAVAAAYKKKVVHKKRSVKGITTKRKKHADYNKPTVNIQIGKKLSALQSAKNHLAKALLDYDLADTVKGTRDAQKRKIKFRKLVKSLKK